MKSRHHTHTPMLILILLKRRGQVKQLLIPLFFLLFRTPLSSQANSQSHPFAFFNPPPGWVVSNPCFLGEGKDRLYQVKKGNVCACDQSVDRENLLQ